MITIDKAYIVLDANGEQVSCVVRFADKLYIKPHSSQKRLSKVLFGEVYEDGEIDFKDIVGFKKTFLLPYIKMFLNDGRIITFNIFQKQELIDLVKTYREELSAISGKQLPPLFIN